MGKLAFAIAAALLCAGCQQGGAPDVPTVAVDLVLKDARIKADIEVGELALRVRLTPDQVDDLMQSIAAQDGGSDGGGGEANGA